MFEVGFGLFFLYSMESLCATRVGMYDIINPSVPVIIIIIIMQTFIFQFTIAI